MRGCVDRGPNALLFPGGANNAVKMVLPPGNEPHPSLLRTIKHDTLHTLLTCRPHISLHPYIIFCQPIPFQCAFHIYFFLVLLISCLNHPQSTHQLNLVIQFKLSPQNLILFPPSSLSFSTTIFTSRLSSILSSSFLHP